jgi:hypothetical protein
MFMTIGFVTVEVSGRHPEKSPVTLKTNQISLGLIKDTIEKAGMINGTCY